MKALISKLLSHFGVRINYVPKNFPSTYRPELEKFEAFGTQKEWRQILMYSSIVEKTNQIPGDFIEFGVASGASFMAFARLLDIHNSTIIHPAGKKTIYGFDSFYGLPKVESIDNPKNKKIIKKGDFNSIGALDKLNNFLKKYKSGKLIKGLFEEKIDIFLEENPHITFSLIHIDCDIYSSTKLILNKIVDRLNVGGIILFDEIFHKDFPGETYAFLEFYQKELSLKKGIRLEFHRNTSMPWKWYCTRIQ